jgi:hypothetical protein
MDCPRRAPPITMLALMLKRRTRRVQTSSKSLRLMTRRELIVYLLLCSAVPVAFLAPLGVAIYQGDRRPRIWLGCAFLLVIFCLIVGQYAGELLRRRHARSWQEREQRRR